MEEETPEWDEQIYHLNRLKKVRALLSEVKLEFAAAERERCLNFLTEDQEIKSYIAKFYALATPENNSSQLNPIYAGIARDYHGF